MRHESCMPKAYGQMYSHRKCVVCGKEFMTMLNKVCGPCANKTNCCRICAVPMQTVSEGEKKG